MLRPRIIPCLLIRDGGLVKTVKFDDGKYVGDPLNAVRIFNEKEVDELFVVDIDATVHGRPPQFDLIKKLAMECRMPLAYGGGVKSAQDARRIVGLGAEKVAVSAAAIQNPELLSRIGEAVGQQSVVVVMDVKKRGLLGRYEVTTHNGKKFTGLSPVDWAKQLGEIGIGELVVNSVDNDGVMSGYDYKLIDSIRDVVEMPLTVIGGAGSFEDVSSLIERYGVIGAAAGSIFVFKGKYKAVLIQYPSHNERDSVPAA